MSRNSPTTFGALVYGLTMGADGHGGAQGLGDHAKWFERVVGRVEHIVLIAVIISMIDLLRRRAVEGARAQRDS